MSEPIWKPGDADRRKEENAEIRRSVTVRLIVAQRLHEQEEERKKKKPDDDSPKKKPEKRTLGLIAY